MQIDAIVLYDSERRARSITFKPGALNIITGDSRTGKSSLINILRFCLGSDSPHSPHGPIRDSVAWYGALAHIGGTKFFVGRPAPPADSSTTEAMLAIGAAGIPTGGDLTVNATSADVRDYIGGLLGLEENLFLRGPGTSQASVATFVHSLTYCFQGQGEIANPDILFHRQNSEWQPRTIRDTLPYFLGAHGLDELRLRQELTERRRDLRAAEQTLRLAQREIDTGLGRASALLSEAREVQLLDRQVPDPATLAEARALLREVVDAPRTQRDPGGSTGDEVSRLGLERESVRDQLREIAEQMRGLDAFTAASDSYATELSEQHARLASIGLLPSGADGGSSCAMCGQELGDVGSDAFNHVERSLHYTERQLDAAHRDAPRVEATRTQLGDARRALEGRLAEIGGALASLTATDDLVLAARDALDRHSYVQGRIIEYLDGTPLVEGQELDGLRGRVNELAESIRLLEERLDPDELRSRVTSRLAIVSRQLNIHARSLGLEHSDPGVRIDLDRLTIVADTLSGPAYMDRGEIGSGMNWVGYHLCAYLALHEFFLSNDRPVPGFLMLDQPSQAFFPRDRNTGGDLEELEDTDRENTRRLYRLMYDVCESVTPGLQIIALDHADFDDDWFRASVVERWRNGEALIPGDWLDTADGSDAT